MRVSTRLDRALRRDRGAEVREDATILAHYYQDGEIQELADFTGDSLKLARVATQVDESRRSSFAGCTSWPRRPRCSIPRSGCSCPTSRPVAAWPRAAPRRPWRVARRQLRAEGRRFQTVTYINSSAAVKSLSDWVVTSGNAEAIIGRVPADVEILFVPDRHLGSYLQEVTGRPMILWEGSCMVHEVFSVGDLLRLKRRLPRAVTIAHPECPANIREQSDFIGGHRGDDPLRRRFRRADRLPGRDRGEHALAIAVRRAAAPLPPRPGHHLRLQQVPAHGPQHARKAPRLPRTGPSRDRLAARVRSCGRGAPPQPARTEFGLGKTKTKPRGRRGPASPRGPQPPRRTA